MADRIKADFQERRARILQKHAARDPEWQKYRKERRASVGSVIASLCLALGMIAVGWKGISVAQLGPEGFRQTVATLADSAAGQALPAWIFGADPVSGAIATFLTTRDQPTSIETIAALSE